MFLRFIIFTTALYLSSGESGNEGALPPSLQPSAEATEWMSSIGWMNKEQATCGWEAATLTTTKIQVSLVISTRTKTETVSKPCTEGWGWVEAVTTSSPPLCTSTTQTMGVSLVLDPELIVDYTTTTVYSTFTVTPTVTTVETQTIFGTLTPIHQVATVTSPLTPQSPTTVTEFLETESDFYTTTTYETTSFYLGTTTLWAIGDVIYYPEKFEYFTLPLSETTIFVTETQISTGSPATILYTGSVINTQVDSSFWEVTTTPTLLHTENVVTGGYITFTPGSVSLIKETTTLEFTGTTDLTTTFVTSPNLCMLTLTESVFQTETAPEVTTTLRTTFLSTFQSTYIFYVTSFTIPPPPTFTQTIFTKINLVTKTVSTSAPSDFVTVTRYYGGSISLVGTSTYTITPAATKTLYDTTVVKSTTTPMVFITGDIQTGSVTQAETFLTKVAEAELVTASVRSTTIVLEPSQADIPIVTVTKSEMGFEARATCSSCG